MKCNKKIHILGICGTFMGSLAILAKQAGWSVSGQDAKVYPPMSTQLLEQGITLTDGYAVEDLPSDCDFYVIGNVMTRGMPVVEHILNQRLPFMSGPEFLAKHILSGQHVLAVTGTHGKTTTTTILTWILEYAGLQPGYLIGGVPNNFPGSAALGAGKYFVIEGDEYDCAFFDKRSKFLHYLPQTLIINNIEYDHADIFPNLEAILTQFHYLLRFIPSSGLIITRSDDQNIATVLGRGCWSKTVSFALEHADYTQQLLASAKLSSSLLGTHNILNTLAAVAAAQNVGVSTEVALQALTEFKGVKRRLEFKAEAGGVKIYSDFAHHPTAIATTLEAFKQLVGVDKRIIALVDICSNTMKAGVHQATLAASAKAADLLYFHYPANLNWNVHEAWALANKKGGAFKTQEELVASLLPELKPNDRVLIMSNGAFESIAVKLKDSL